MDTVMPPLDPLPEDTAADPSNPAEAEPPRLNLHIPAHQPMPGQRPDFSYLPRLPAGIVERPDIGVPATETHHLAYSLIRVLDDDDKAVGPWDPQLDPETLRRGLRAMMLTRAYDDRMYRAQRQGKTSFYMKCTGEEAIAVAAAAALDRDDMHFPTYRQQGLLISRGYPLTEMMNQIYSNKGDKLKGRQLPIMYSDKAHGFFSISGNLATQFPQAVGWAMAAAIKGDSRILMGWVGDAAIGEWDDERHAAMTAECDAAVRAAQKESEKVGILPDQGKDDVGSMFDDVYADVPSHLAEQRQQALDETR